MKEGERARYPNLLPIVVMGKGPCYNGILIFPVLSHILKLGREKCISVVPNLQEGLDFMDWNLDKAKIQ